MNTAKFLPPRPVHILDRDRLLSFFSKWEDKKLVIIHAQAGQGKSALAAGYARSLGTPFSWYNFDRDDDNPEFFLASVGRAVQLAFPGLLPRLPIAPRIDPGMVALHGALRPWADQLFTGIARPFLIVFDDLHATSSPPVLMRLLQALIEITPHTVRFMLLSRTRPDLQLSVLKTKRAVGELSGSDLKFSDAEVEELFGSVFGMHLDRNEAALINGMIEGWPAGLVLMDEYLSSTGQNLQSVLSKKGLSRFSDHIFEYMAQDVFAHLPDHLKRFLLYTSVSDYLPAPLLEILWSRTKGAIKLSAAMLVEQLLNRNLFITAVDDNANTIRYHSLFRDFLRNKLLATVSPREVRSLYRLASGYFRKTGELVRAIDLLIEDAQFEKALDQIEACGPTVIARGQIGTMLRWREALPIEKRSCPWFSLSQALASRLTDPSASLASYDAAFRAFRLNRKVPSCLSGQMQALCGIIESSFYADGNFTRMGRTAEQARKLLTKSKKESRSVRARLLLAIGMAWFFTGKLCESRDALVQALDLFRKDGELFYQITTVAYLTSCALYLTDFRLAHDVVRKGFEAQTVIPEETGTAALLFLVKGMTALFEGKFVEAQESLDRCRQLSDKQALQSVGSLSVDFEGLLKVAQGAYAKAIHMLTACKHAGETSGNFFMSSSAAHMLAIAYLFQGKFEKARNESDYALAIQSRSGSRLFYAIYLTVSGAVNLKLGKLKQAETELRSAVASLDQMHAAQQASHGHLLLALLYLKLKNQNKALIHLRKGFSAGQDRAFFYYAIVPPEDLKYLAREAIGADICVEYCRSLLDGSGASAPALRLECLGGFKLFRGDALIKGSELKGKLSKTFLKLLVANGRNTLPRDQAIDMLWPDSAAQDSGAKFNAMVSRLRKTLRPHAAGKDIFCQAESGIGLNHDALRIDANLFLSRVDHIERLKTAGKEETLLKEYEAAIDLYQGDFLPEDLYNDWSAGMRDRLRQHYLRLLQEAASLCELVGEKKKAEQFHEKLFLADSSNEKACRWLMMRYLSTGQRNEAIRTYERCERVLNREMDLEPEEKTKKLFRSILEGQ